MSSGSSALGQVGAVCFGIVVGFITYRTLVRPTEKAAISVLATVVATIGGAAVTGLFAPGASLFGWYSIGLLMGMAVFFIIFGRLNGLQQLLTLMNVRTEVPSSTKSTAIKTKEQGPNRPSA